MPLLFKLIILVVSVCSGTSDGTADVVGKSDDMKRMRIMYENCTHVMGNLEIVRLETRGNTDNDFSFLDQIQEVDTETLLY